MSEPSNRREEILRCTQSLIIAGGYNSFSYADISKVVGIRKASIHHHFPTKANLVRELILQYRQNVKAGLAELGRLADPLEQLRRYARYWEACVTDGSLPMCVCALLAVEMPVLPEEVAVEVRGHFQDLSTWVTSILQRGVKNKSIRLEKPAAVEAEIFIASVHGALLSARAHGDAKMFGEIIRPALALLVKR
ncbi:MAG: TetR/AcrR family transcriptional regulator [Verrucomicrobia bacterium]|nr:TetR/AcrR family transcriptional regulator [Verrucomicrobiota bacterium]